jgi:uncharacterized RDD family membrane protein YckC
MARGLAQYHGHETARMERLEGVPLASFTARCCAFFIDMAIAGLSFVIPAMLGAVVLIKLGWLHNNVHINFSPFHHEEWPSLIWFVALTSASNYIGNGATIGKKLLRIRAVSLVHERLSLWHSVERALGYGASALEAFFGFLQYFIDPNRQTVHDRIAKTIVVSERRRQAPALVEPALRAAESASEAPVEGADPEPPEMPEGTPAPPAS